MVALGRKVKVRYTGYLEDGQVFDSSEMHDGQLLEFLVGRQQVIPGLDKAVSEMELGQVRTVDIPAEMAYGVWNPDLVERVPCDIFPHWEQLPMGGFIVLRTKLGDLRVKVLGVEDGMVTVDKNHELAGRNLRFDLELVDVHGEGGSLVEQELESGCSCGCDLLKEALDPHHDCGHGHART